MNDDQVSASREDKGRNQLPTPKRPPLIVSYFKQMANLFSLVLFICGTLSLAVFIIDTSYWINLYTGLIFWAVAFFNAALEFWQVYSSAKTLEGFLGLVPADALVLRDGQLLKVPASEVVVGDLIHLKTGNKIPSDGRVLWSEHLRVDNSSLTGESEPQERDALVDDCDALEARNLVFSGTIVIAGEAVALVVRVGSETVIGRLAKYAVTAPPRVSALEHEMTIVFRRLVACALCFGILALTLGFSLGLPLTDTINAAIGIFVSFLPQGLPATMTILLTTAAKRMAARNVLVKELRSVETLGAMTLLATDKTGTLTQNKMAVVGGWIQGKIYNSVEELDGAVADRLANFFLYLALCTSCKLDATEKEKPVDERNIFGDATEVGILHYYGRLGSLDALFEDNPKVVDMPFNSTTKWHLTIYWLDEQYRVILKGAPERVLKKCKNYHIARATKTIDDGFIKEFQKIYEYFAGSGLRILALATLPLDTSQYPKGFDFQTEEKCNFPTNGLEFLGFICLRDPPKAGVSWAVDRLRDAGISVVMVTGDHPLTAEAIARQVGIVTKMEAFRRPPTVSDSTQRPHVKTAIIHGEDVDSMSSSDWARLSTMKELVFARTAPRHKLEIVKQMQSAGHVVGVSGDGVNDSPALRKANLGISMNKTASDVSKDAAHLILLDDNFVSIVAGVFEGRLIFENVKKSIRYTLSHITAEVSAMLIYALLLIPPPLSPILLIFIDVFSELGPAVSFAGEPPEYDLMALPPRSKVVHKTSPERRLAQFFRHYHLKSWVEMAMVKVTALFYLPDDGEKLVDKDLVFWSFFEGGLIIAAGAWGAYILALVVAKVALDTIYRSDTTYWRNDSPPLTLADGSQASAAQQLAILGSIQAAFFLAIMLVQWVNVFIQKHRYRYPWGWDMFINKLTYFGILSSMFIVSCVVFIPVLHDVFETNIPPALALAPPFAAAFFLFIYEVIRRRLRHKGYFGGIPSKVVLKPPADIRRGIEAPPIPRSRELSVIERPSF